MNDLIADSRTTTWTMDHSDRDDITYDAHHSNNRDSNVLSKSKIKQFTMLKIMDKLRYSHVCVFVRRCWWSSHLPCFDSTLFWKIFYTFFYLSTSSCRQIHDWRRCKNRKKCQFFCVVLLFIENSWNLSISLPAVIHVLLIWFLRPLATNDVFVNEQRRDGKVERWLLFVSQDTIDLLWHCEFHELELI